MEPTVRDAQPPDAGQLLMQIAGGYVPAAALWVAAELGIADRLAGGPRRIDELAADTGTNADTLSRVLRLLAMIGIFTEAQPGQFALTPAAALLRADVPGSLRDMVLWIAEPFHLHIAEHLMDSVRTGQTTIEHVTGESAWRYFEQNAAVHEVFQRAMTSMSMQVAPAVLEAYDFSPFSTVVDVAGGHGFLLTTILQRHPRLTGILFDLPDVAAAAARHIAELGLSGRCTVQSGDFFAGVPAGGDAYVMKSIIHDWPDERALVLLSNCRRALGNRPNGRLVLTELVVPPGNGAHLSKLIDIEMLFYTGGRERTAAQFEALLGRAGFRLLRIIPTRSPMSLVEAAVAG